MKRGLIISTPEIVSVSCPSVFALRGGFFDGGSYEGKMQLLLYSLFASCSA